MRSAHDALANPTLEGSSSSKERICEKLRQLIQDCVSKHLNASALFFATKLQAFSDGEPSDVYLLAQAFFISKQYRRAFELLSSHEMFDNTLRFRYMAALCKAECSEWEDSLDLIGSDETPGTLVAKEKCTRQAGGGAVNIYAAICVLRARAFEALDNRQRAIRWYIEALKSDPFCYEAYDALFNHQMLTNEQETDLLSSLQVSGEDEWLTLLYSTMGKKYESASQIDEHLRLLEGAGSGLRRPLQPSSRHGNASDVVASNNPAALAAEGMVVSDPGARENSDNGGVHRRSKDPRDLLELDRQAHEDVVSSLKSDLHVQAARADYLLGKGDALEAYKLCCSILRHDSRALECLNVHLACLVELGKKNELFQLGHRLVNDIPEEGLAWYAVGCYYLSTGQFDSARRFFGKATQLDPRHAPSWLAYGHAFAAQDESDQALAAYRTAARLFPGLHQPLLGMGREYQHMNNHMLAEQMYLQAYGICGTDPLVCNELGVLFYQKKEYEMAGSWFRRAKELLPQDAISPASHPTLLNLAHTLRKLGKLEEAITLYNDALALAPTDPGALAAIGFTYHLQGELTRAIESYHAALGFRPECSMTQELVSELLGSALEAHCEHCCEHDDPGLM